ncbi:hypothetical protein [Streptomyces lydicus]|uniref:hypothetical protein n=1 Tax=Streptomyces lydicus TaxID=47763 RepID=UPI0036E95156
MKRQVIHESLDERVQQIPHLNDALVASATPMGNAHRAEPTSRHAGYEPTQAESVLARLSPHCRRPQKADSELQALREARLALRISGTPRPRVGTYTMVNPGQDPAPRLAVARALAAQHNWPQAATPAVDFTGMTDPATRPQLARLLASLADGEVQGIVATSRTDFTHLNDFYGEVLDKIHDRGGFLALATREIDI